ncbi:MAG: putative DNA binding domain-containing protein [Lachnospiraceae bacterium]|nr:putative DNA binding domain-containing protein [Lachnospiraceae bacterium]
MTTEELIEKLDLIQKMKCESPTLEIKSAEKGCPKHLYDTLSSFSNQDDGGIIIFGVDETQDYKEVGVYDPQDIQKRINEQCLQMEPVVRPLLTVGEKDGKFYVSAEIPGADITDRPVFYRGKGRVKGSFIRVGDSDESMTEYEVYSYEAYRKKYQDDVREIERVSFTALDQELLTKYIELLKRGKPRLAAIPDNEIYELMSIKRNHAVTLAAVLNFSPYPQAYFPQLCILATVVPGKEIGAVGKQGERFLDNQRIEGNIPDMLDGAMQFVSRNMRTKTIINPNTGKREDRTDYPVTAIREAVLNALVHRDYSIHTEGMPIQLIMYEDRIEIRNPGGIYGRIRVDQLGKVQPDTRNPVIASELEVLKVTENRYSGIPTIRRTMQEYHLPQPEFLDERGSFIIKLYKYGEDKLPYDDTEEIENRELLLFCKTPRTRKEICDYLGLNSVTYAIQTYVMPLVEKGLIQMSIPDKPKSPKQLFYCGERRKL